MKTYLKKNKALFILPLALLPFVILIFYILGGGTDAESNEKHPDALSEEANYQIPQADTSIEILDKLQAYESQSSGLHPQTKDYEMLGKKDSLGNLLLTNPDSTELENSLIPIQQNEASSLLLAHIREKELSVSRELKSSNVETVVSKKKKHLPEKIRQKPLPKKQVLSNGIEELDQVFQKNAALSIANDSLKFQMNQLEAQLQQINQQRSASFKLEKPGTSGFNPSPARQNHPIKAEIYETTTVLDGNRVKLRLLENTRLQGSLFAKNSFLYGTCKIENERLKIHINSIVLNQNIIPVELSVTDLDGVEGLYVPDNAARNVTKSVGSSTNTSSLFGVNTDPLTYVGVRAADRTAQTLFQRIRLKRVTIKKSTIVYLINQNL